MSVTYLGNSLAVQSKHDSTQGLVSVFNIEINLYRA